MRLSNTKHSIIKDLVITRKNLIEFIIVAILLAFGVDLLAGHFVNFVEDIPLVSILVGTFFIIGSISYLAGRLYRERVTNSTYKAFLVYNIKRNEIIPVNRYKYSESASRFLQSAFVENNALKVLWDKAPLRDYTPRQLRGAHRPQNAAALLIEVTEYFVIEELSTHLTDYFNYYAAADIEQEKLKVYNRSDVPEVLLTNRFLEMFSRPMEDRQAFMKHSGPKSKIVAEVEGHETNDIDETNNDEPGGEVVWADSAGGAFYSRFDLVLPKESTVTRPEENKFEINTKKMKMSIKVRFEGTCTVFPQGFEEYYLDIKDWFSGDWRAYVLYLDVHVSMKLRALLSRVGWEYYHWIDSFLDTLEDKLSQEAFFKRIEWESAFTVLRGLEIMQLREKQPKSPNGK